MHGRPPGLGGSVGDRFKRDPVRVCQVDSLRIAKLDPAAKKIELWSAKWLNRMLTNREVVTLLQALYNTVSWEL